MTGWCRNCGEWVERECVGGMPGRWRHARTGARTCDPATMYDNALLLTKAEPVRELVMA